VQSAGILIGDEVLNIAGAAGIWPGAACLPKTVKGIIETGAVGLDVLRNLEETVQSDRAGIRARLKEAGNLTGLAATKLLPPVPDPGMILAGGMNYHQHLAEMNTPVPPKPVSFVKSTAALIGPGAPIKLPASHPDMVDWEGEFSAVIGRRCFNVSESEALDYVAGYTILNDVSARDWVASVFASTGIMGPVQTWEHNLLGKQFPTFAPLGPVLVTRDEIKDPGNLRIVTKLNGKMMQDANTSDLVFSLPQLIAYYSQFYCFLPGDIVTTGSPAGVGYGRNPKVFMHAGDVIEVTVDKIGTLSNPIRAAS
jgi:2-keto-4-pentenoate hydratase/2-oxohepta-3-ene-1,7-dioic acid hydratase in catechol pathway